jgi:3-hydroxybutyryl-CoA dehydrogenase
MSIQQIAVVGAGTMGNGIAHVLALHGYEVILIDVESDRLDAATSTIAQNLDRQIEKEVIDSAAKGAALDRIGTATDTATGVSGAELVVEAVPEEQDLKAEVFGTLDRHAPDDAVLASNTSSISITWIAAQTERPAQVIGMHFFNPVPVMGLVEVVRGQRTSDATVEVVESVAAALDKTAVEVEDYPGFLRHGRSGGPRGY